MGVFTMHTEKRTKTWSRRGMALFVALLFVAIFSSFGLAILTMSSRNMHVANNHSQAGRALESALSGMEVMNYWMTKVSIPGGTADDERLNAVATDLAANDIALGSENPVTLDSSDPKSFYAHQLESVDDNTFCLKVTGQAGGLQRTVAINYNMEPNTNNIFKYGVATKGPLHLSGNILLDGTNIAVESDVYIASENNDNVLSIIGNSQIAGDVQVTNPDAIVFLQGGQAGIGTDADGNQVTGEAESQDYIKKGVAPVEFPAPNAGHFEQYVTGDTIDAATDLTVVTTFENVRIAPNTNPFFTDVNINGIMFIESPNIVTFAGNCNITGLIIGDGDVNDDSGTNQLIFQGNVQNASVADLPLESQFDGLREETGTFLMAPGFSASFGGNFATLNGAIAANGITFFGDAGGTIAGSVLNYSDTPMILSGNSDLFFNRSDATEVPAGFELEIVLQHEPASYDEPVS